MLRNSLPGSGVLILSFDLPREAYERTMKQGAILVKPLEIAPGAAQLRVIVRDPRTGNVGSVTIPIGQVKSAP